MNVESFVLWDSIKEMNGEDSYIRIFNVIDTSSLPCKRTFMAVARIRYEEAELGHHEFYLKMKEPTGNERLLAGDHYQVGQSRKLGFHINFAVDTLQMALQDIEFSSHGIYDFSLSVDRRPIATTSIVVPFPVMSTN